MVGDWSEMFYSLLLDKRRDCSYKEGWALSPKLFYKQFLGFDFVAVKELFLDAYQDENT